LRLISAASVLLLAYLIWGSRAWPLIHDAPLMHYVAWLIDQGGVPYRDAFDMNLPGVYLLHLAVLRMGGPGDPRGGSSTSAGSPASAAFSPRIAGISATAGPRRPGGCCSGSTI
jgi:hypothetical protein